jgi:hypothetical protein
MLRAERMGGSAAVPRISEFYGIVISMYHRDHAPPHFHATYGEFEAVVGIDPIRILDGRLPHRARGFVMEWAALHQSELRENWQKAQQRTPPARIAPLD